MISNSKVGDSELSPKIKELQVFLLAREKWGTWTGRIPPHLKYSFEWKRNSSRFDENLDVYRLEVVTIEI